LKLPAPDGKLRETDCANTQSILRAEYGRSGAFFCVRPTGECA